MKKILSVILMISVIGAGTALASETETPSKADMIIDSAAMKTQEFTDKTSENLKTGTRKVNKFFREKSTEIGNKTVEGVKSSSQKAGDYIKDKSTEAGEITVEYTKSSAEKAKKAAERGATTVTNKTAKGLKKAAEKMQNSADKTIERTEKTLDEMSDN